MDAKDRDYSGIEQQWRAAQPVATATDQKATRINWMLVFLLTSFGLLQACLIRQEFFKALPLWAMLVLWLLVLPGAIVGWIVKHVRGRYFLHGVLVGIFYQWMFVIGWLIIGYFGSPSASREHPPDAVFVTVGGIPPLYWGGLAWLVGKIVNSPDAYARK